jgi:hypothetical protein
MAERPPKIPEDFTAKFQANMALMLPLYCPAANKCTGRVTATGMEDDEASTDIENIFDLLPCVTCTCEMIREQDASALTAAANLALSLTIKDIETEIEIESTWS